MKETIKFYKCPVCGNVIEIIDGDVKRITCCGKNLEEIEANTIDASIEKHLPVYEKIGNEILARVGDIEHPMDEDHYIMWIAQVDEGKITKVRLYPGGSTETRFPYIPETTLYAYCNKHGLWKTTIN